MGKPSHFRVKEPTECCAGCRYKKFDAKTYVRRCVFHNFDLPDNVKELEVTICDNFEPVEGDN